MNDSAPASPSSSPARILFDGEWKYLGYHDCPSVCHFRLYQPVDATQPFVAIFTELDRNPGTSVTNRIEYLASMAWQWLERPMRGLMVIEHYPDRGIYNPIRNWWQFPEEFDLVTFSAFDGHRFACPQWKPSNRKEVEALIGQPFPSVPK